MNSCGVTLKKNHFLVICEHRTVSGGRFRADPMIKIERIVATPLTVGEAVIKVLRAPRRVIPVPIDFTAALAALREFEGFKNQRESDKATVFPCSANETDDNKVSVTPYPTKEQGGYLPDTEKRVICDYSAESIGKALFEIYELNQ